MILARSTKRACSVRLRARLINSVRCSAEHDNATATRVTRHQDRFDEASSLTDRAAFAAQQASQPELSFRWDWQRARLARKRGHTEAALTSDRRAIGELQSVRQD